MLICTLISVFRLASALEREGVGLGVGTGERGNRWGRMEGAWRGPVAPPSKGRLGGSLWRNGEALRLTRFSL